jgi:hypothetical protein
MEASPLIRLDLRAPLLYVKTPDIQPFCYAALEGENAGEELFCFDLDPAQSSAIEPERDRLLGPLIFAARSPRAGDGPETVRLPAGLYLFVQKREALGRQACIDLAIEQQKDALWERLKPGNQLYARFLFEDKKPVTQIFRPYSA